MFKEVMEAGAQHPIDQIFAAVAGPTAMARLLGIKKSTASEMKRRRSIPVRYWPDLLKGAIAQGVKLSEADLVKAHCKSC